ncbi:MAG: ABC transporter permease [Acidimicrobiales bacterium]
MNRRTARALLVLRWSWRDLRRRWVSVLAISLIIAIGVGVFAALGSTSSWRRLSNDASFSALNLHDLRVELAEGDTAPEGALAALAQSIPHASSLTARTERLRAPTQVDASTLGEAVLVPGELVGGDLEPGAVDALHLERGGPPAPGEIVLESKFAAAYQLPERGEVALSGGRRAVYSGHGVTPEFFLVTGAAEGGFLAEQNFAALFGSLATAQALTGQPGRVNDLVLRLAPGAEVETVRAELADALGRAGFGAATVSTRRDEASYRLLYDDIDSDQQLWNVISALVLAAAAIAAFNLVSRIVEAQRREIGIGMAMGVSPLRLAVRPLLIGAQVALAGAVLGVAVGLVVGAALRNLFLDVLPLPVWRTPLQLDQYGRAAALGFVVPFAATSYPVWRAVRVAPIEAIRVGHRAARGAGAASLGRRARLPGGSLGQLPVRNLLRNPRRSLLTVGAVGAALAALVSILGMLDSFRATIARGEAELTRAAADRVTVELTGHRPLDAPDVAAVVASPVVDVADLGLKAPASGLGADGVDVDLVVSLLDLDGAQWTPSVRSARPAAGRPGILLSAKAAADLSVSPGDAVRLRHAVRAPGAAGGFAPVETEFTVTGLHPSPLRPLAFADLSAADAFGLAGLTNTVEVRPAAGFGPSDVQRALFGLPSVASAQPVTAVVELFEDALEQFLGFLLITAVAVAVLATLISFNSTSIAVDERAREHATMFAFGLTVRRVLGLIGRETVALGLAATALGLGLGYALMAWIVRSLVADTVPEFGFELALSATTLLVTAGVGVISMTITPLLLARGLSRMDIPDTLRVME